MVSNFDEGKLYELARNSCRADLGSPLLSFVASEDGVSKLVAVGLNGGRPDSGQPDRLLTWLAQQRLEITCGNNEELPLGFVLMIDVGSWNSGCLPKT